MINIQNNTKLTRVNSALLDHTSCHRGHVVQNNRIKRSAMVITNFTSKPYAGSGWTAVMTDVRSQDTSSFLNIYEYAQRGVDKRRTLCTLVKKLIVMDDP